MNKNNKQVNKGSPILHLFSHHWKAIHNVHCCRVLAGKSISKIFVPSMGALRSAV